MFCFFIAEPAPPRVDLQLGRNKRCVIIGKGGPQRETLEGTSCQSIWQLPRRGLPGGSCYPPVFPTMRLLSLHTTSSIQNDDIALTSEMPFFVCLFSNTCSAQRKREGWGEGGMDREFGVSK